MHSKLWETQDVGRENPEPTEGFGMAWRVSNSSSVSQVLEGKEQYDRIREAGDTNHLLELMFSKEHFKTDLEAYICQQFYL